jgi:hypothetical protein
MAILFLDQCLCCVVEWGDFLKRSAASEVWAQGSDSEL